MNFSMSKSDSSFYFHFYDDAIEKVKLPRTPLENRNDGRIDFDDYVETNFFRNKISLHESGIIHSTDRRGNKLRKGIVGLPFAEIEVSRLVLICGPKKIDTLTPYNKVDPSTDMIIHLPKGIKPFTLHFDVYRKSRSEETDISNPNLLFGGFVMVEYSDKDFGLRLYGQSVLGDANWPPFNLILTRLKENKA